MLMKRQQCLFAKQINERQLADISKREEKQ